MAAKDNGRFDFLLRTVKAVEDNAGRSSILCTASSDDVDLGVDRFTLSALRQMEKAFPGMTIFLNHKYVVPDDVFGKVTSAVIVLRDGRNDLDLTIEVTGQNQRAIDAYNQIKEGIVLGVSVGVLVMDADFIEDKLLGKKVLEIRSLYTLEASIVGIPANRRSWVHGALKAASANFAGNEDARALMEGLFGGLKTSVGGRKMARKANNEEPVTPIASADPIEEVEPVVADPVIEEPAAAVDDTTVVVVVVDDDDDDDENDPSEPNADYERPVSSAERIALIDSLRKSMADPDREWFTIKDAEPSAEQADSVAEVIIYDSIGSGISAQSFISAIMGVKASRMNVRINCPGGTIDDGIAIRNVLARHPADVYTYVDGIAASMASVIALVGKEVVMELDSMLMIHEPWGCQQGDTYMMAREARILNKYGANIANTYARKAGGTRDEWREVMRDEGWYTAEEAVEAGLADRVGDSSDPAIASKSFDARFLSLCKNVPESAKKFFAAADPDLTASIENTEDDNRTLATALVDSASTIDRLSRALAEARKKSLSLKEDLKDKDAEIDNWASVVAETLAQIEIIKDAPLPRKIMPEEQFTAMSETYPWLDERIIAHLARNKNTG